MINGLNNYYTTKNIGQGLKPVSTRQKASELKAVSTRQRANGLKPVSTKKGRGCKK